jgi:DNA-binding winged helix-turn-helix (wHTH) protein
MAHWISDSSGTSIAFEPFRVFPVQRLLEDGEPIRIASRSYEILLALLERPGELVTKDDLIARVWPNTFVEPANLAVQIAGLRRALRDGAGQSCYVINIPGRGYRFVAPVAVETECAPDALGTDLVRPPELPVRSSQTTPQGMGELTRKLQEQGVLTVARQDGGKAAGALALLKTLLGGDRSGVWLLDLRPVGDS